MDLEKIKNSAPRPEKKKELSFEILTINEVGDLEDLFEAVERANQKHQLDLVMIREYRYPLGHLVKNIKHLSQIAKEKKIDFIFAPENESAGKVLSWGEIKTQLRGKGIAVEDSDLPDEAEPETVGLFISRKGTSYLFPKTWQRSDVHRPVHRIPGTKIGVTICGEIHEIKPEDLEGIDVLYNPSREGDDIYARFRTLYESKKGKISRDQMVDLLNLKKFLENEPSIETVKFFGEKMKLREEREKFVDEKIKVFSKNALKNSMYVERIEELLSQKNIPVIRCDVGRGSGVLNKLPSMKISRLKQTDDSQRFNLRIYQYEKRLN